MAFTNIPPNLQDIFYSITDRIAKLETGPNQPMDYAQSAQSTALTSQSVATDAQIQAINAGIQANYAASQATIAQSQATIASSQATIAQTTANGKNVVSYGTASPSVSGTKVGDLYFQFDGSNNVIAQYTWNGSSWVSNQMTSTVIAQLDAGKITTGTLSSITISAGSGANSFYVSSLGVLSAQGAYIKGNITADTGTFNGTINAATGYFGNYAGGNYWSIGSSGITGVGSATITGGLISGSSINIGSGVFQVSSAGALTATSGVIGGWSISSTKLYTGAVGSETQYLNAAGGGLLTGSYTIGTLGVNGNLTIGTDLLLGGTVTSANFNLSSSTEFRVPYAYSNTVTNAATVWISSTGQLRRSTASSQRYKTDITNLVDIPELNPQALYNLPVRAFRYKDEYISKSDDRAGALIPGFIAEEVDAIYPIAADYVEGAETWNERMIIPGLLALIQDQEKRIKQLEGK